MNQSHYTWSAERFEAKMQERWEEDSADANDYFKLAFYHKIDFELGGEAGQLYSIRNDRSLLWIANHGGAVKSWPPIKNHKFKTIVKLLQERAI